MPDQLQETIASLPQTPGVYKYLDKAGTIIYVGKAKKLKSRVGSYFNNSPKDKKTARLVSEIAEIKFILTDTENDALLLENNLIKTHWPKYNILLKDGKMYPYICVSKERFPKVSVSRDPDKAKGRYFGPFTSGKAMNGLLDLFKVLFKIRVCSLNLSEKNIAEGKHKVCLEYHIKNCLGPCVGLQSESSYNADIEQLVNILKGKLSLVKRHYKEKMSEAAENLAFEKAQHYKILLESLEGYQSKSLITNATMPDTDVFAVLSDENSAYIGFMRAVEGRIVMADTLEVKKKMDESIEEILHHAVLSVQEKLGLEFGEIATNADGIAPAGKIAFFVPQRGDAKSLVELSLKGVFHLKNEKIKEQAKRAEGKEKSDTLLQLQEDLRLNSYPKRIECFDNSNIQGTNPVSSMVCFKDGKPAKSEYRHFNVKTVIGPDDFASMNEVVGRRYRRVLEEKQRLPDLIVVDGGKGQLSAACDALRELGIYGQVAIVGIAKRLEEIYYPEDPLPLHISKKSPSLRLLQRLRDEAHRFAITFHRQKRSASSLTSSLDDIKGIGGLTRTKLLQHFKSVEKIKAATDEELEAVVGKHKAALVREGLG